jgi:hypothetical protein
MSLIHASDRIQQMPVMRLLYIIHYFEWVHGRQVFHKTDKLTLYEYKAEDARLILEGFEIDRVEVIEEK